MTPDELYRIVSDDPTHRRISTIRKDVMTTLKRVSQIVLFVSLLFPSVTAAQIVLYSDPSVFAGVDHIGEVGAIVAWDERITQITRSQFEREVRNAFELGIRRMGLVIDSTPPPWGRTAYCGVSLRNRSETDGLVVYSSEVWYSEWVQRHDRDGLQQARVWGSGEVGSIGVTRLNGKGFGERCADSLELAWRTANPGK